MGQRYTQYVNPLIGTGGHGHVFLGANVPFGYVQLGPTEPTRGWDWCSGYHASDSIIVGFGHQHLSGTGIGELGDVAFLLLFVAHLYQKRGQFSLDDALNNNRAKMVRRHPHVFGDVTFDNLDEQLKTWEKIKRAEHTDAEGKPQGLFDSLPSSLPPLTKAYRIHSKAARVGFTWPEDEEVEQQVEAEWLESSAGDDAEAQKHELGDLIFSITEMGRRKGIKASEALDLATARFLRRFARMEELARQQGKDFPDLSLDEKDELWNAAKEEEKAAH